MAALLHLNGPSGVGKSTLARRWAAERPGTLALEGDRVVTMIGGWQADFAAHLHPARRLVLAMAAAHLGAGHDVVWPQLVTSVGEVTAFEDVAAQSGAAYVEVVLGVDPDEQARRFHARPRTSEHEAHLAEWFEERGAEALLRRIHGHLEEYAAQRPGAVRLDTRGRTEEDTYADLVALLDPDAG